MLHLIIHSIHLDPVCCDMWLHVEQCPRDQWVINDRERVARVCLWLTQFDPHCLVTMVIGQSHSLWVTGWIPGATTWFVDWARVNRAEKKKVQTSLSDGYNYLVQRGVLVSLFFSTKESGSYVPHLIPFVSGHKTQYFAAVGISNLLSPQMERSAGSWPSKFWESSV